MRDRSEQLPNNIYISPFFSKVDFGMREGWLGFWTILCSQECPLAVLRKLYAVLKFKPEKAEVAPCKTNTLPSLLSLLPKTFSF